MKTIIVVDTHNLMTPAWECISESGFGRSIAIPNPTTLSTIIMSELAKVEPRAWLLRSIWVDAIIGSLGDFHYAIENAPRTTLRLSIVRNGKQSQVDAEITGELISCAKNKTADCVVLVSGDADFLYPVRELKSSGILTVLAHIDPVDQNSSSTLYRECDERISIPKESVKSFLTEVQPENRDVTREQYQKIVLEVIEKATKSDIIRMKETGHIPSRLDAVMLRIFSKFTGTEFVSHETRQVIRGMITTKVRQHFVGEDAK
jgi:uncharacterized LabA/DUF88 family protein